MASDMSTTPDLSSINDPSDAPLYKPSTFDGTGGAEMWIDQLELYFQINPTTNELKRILSAVSLLRGDAFNWFRALQRSSQDFVFPNWATFRAEFLAQFVSITDVQIAEMDLAKLTQTGSISEYDRVFRNVTLRIPDMTDQEKRRWFIRGLKPNTQRELVRQKPSTYADACKAALIFDKTTYGLFQHLHRPTAPRPYVANPDYMQIDAVNSFRRAPLTPAEREYLRKNQGCFACRKLGHISTNCPFKGQSKNTNRLAVNNIEVPADPVDLAAVDSSDFPSDQ
jgi:Retrotransposon gag protein